MPNPEILTLVIQKGKSNGDRGRLNGPSVDLLHKAGYPFEFDGRRMDCFVVNHPLHIIQRGNREIVSYVAERNADGAIVGYDRDLDVEPRLKGRVRWDVDLDFAECKFRLGVDDGTDEKSQADVERMKFINSLKDEQGHVKPPSLQDVRNYLLDPEHPEHRMEEFIATEHPNALILKAREGGVNLYYRNVAEYSSGVEGARNKDGLKYLFIADLTSTGGTMRDNGYVPQEEELFVSRAGLVRSTAIWSEEKEAIYAALKEALIRAKANPTKDNENPRSKRNGHYNIWTRFPFWRASTASAIHNTTSAALMMLAPFLMIGAKRK